MSTGAKICKSSLVKPLHGATLFLLTAAIIPPAHSLVEVDRDLASTTIVRTPGASASIAIPHIARAPRIEEFLAMEPSEEWKNKLTRLSNFTRRKQNDGEPATQPTDVYLGYDDKALHAVFIAHDSDPGKIRARMSKREAIAADDDGVGMYIDTFGDRRVAYQFVANPLGVQFDSIYSQDTLTDDSGFDTVWKSEGKLTGKGYVVLMSIPFRNIRFPSAATQTWNIAVWRFLGRNSEGSWWPRVSSKYRGILTQTTPITGLENISPAKNLQIIPYTSARSYRSIDPRDNTSQSFVRDTEELIGFDAKSVIHNSVVLDLTFHPDFRQVEIDDPQYTANQMYSLYYPEKRPFFTENASYFQAPMAAGSYLLNTRTIIDPSFGARVTGKQGPYAFGFLFSDDRNPGKSVPEKSSQANKAAFFNVLRLTRNLSTRHNMGLGYSERKFGADDSRVANIDATFNLSPTWAGTMLAAYNIGRQSDGPRLSGGDTDITLQRTSRGFNYIGYFLHRTPGFKPAMAYYGHNNWQEWGQTFAYQFWPKNFWLTRVWTEVYGAQNRHTNGDLSWEGIKPMVKADIKQNTTITAYLWRWQDGFNSFDFPVLEKKLDLPTVSSYGFGFKSTQLRFLNLEASSEWGQRTNVSPVENAPPTRVRYQQAKIDFTFLASLSNWGLSLRSIYLFDRNEDFASRRTIYNSHLMRTTLDLQFNRELSLRVLGQYSSFQVNPTLTGSKSNHTISSNLLITYLLHPGTAIYAGYIAGFTRAEDKPGLPFHNTDRQLFFKASYLLKF